MKERAMDVIIPPHRTPPMNTCTCQQPQSSMSFICKFTWTLIHAPPHPTPPHPTSTKHHGRLQAVVQLDSGPFLCGPSLQLQATNKQQSPVVEDLVLEDLLLLFCNLCLSWSQLPCNSCPHDESTSEFGLVHWSRRQRSLCLLCLGTSIFCDGWTLDCLWHGRLAHTSIYIWYIAVSLHILLCRRSRSQTCSCLIHLRAYLFIGACAPSPGLRHGMADLLGGVGLLVAFRLRVRATWWLTGGLKVLMDQNCGSSWNSIISWSIMDLPNTRLLQNLNLSKHLKLGRFGGCDISQHPMSLAQLWVVSVVSVQNNNSSQDISHKPS